MGIGADTVQLFTANQRQWKGKSLTMEAIECFKRTKEETGFSQLMSHASYLMNLGSPDAENLMKSRLALQEEVKRCQALDIDYLNFHPGSMLQSSRQDCLDRVVESLLMCKDYPRLLIETTAGQGSNVGNQFEDIAYIIQNTYQKISVGVCIDTCHIFAGGYDIRTPEAWERTLARFDKIIGLEHLYAFHLNDSVHGLGSRKDRHASLGKGAIGLDCFQYLMQSKYTYHLPKYLETPEGPSVWKEEIVLLKSFVGL